MKKISLGLFVGCILSCFLFACKPAQEQSKDTNKLFDEVIKLHDEVMPKMSDLYDLKREIENLLEIKNGNIDETQASEIIEALENADEQMMDWMAKFNKPKKETELEIALSYLENEKLKMQNIRTKTFEIIAKAESWISDKKQ